MNQQTISFAEQNKENDQARNVTKIERVREKLILAEQSGFTHLTAEEILQHSKNKAADDGLL